MKTRFPTDLSLQALALALLVTLSFFATAPFTNGESWGSALSFDGVDDYVQPEQNIELARRSFSIEAWAQRRSSDTMDLIAGQGSGGANQIFMFGFHYYAGNQFVFGFYGNEVGSGTAYTDNAWHHWAGTYDAATGLSCLYQDGVLIASDTVTTEYEGSGPLRIGVGYFGEAPNQFDGQIDEVRVWGVARTAAEIQANMRHPLSGTEPHLLAYWKFDEGNGTIASDATTNHVDGALRNGPVWINSPLPRLDWASGLSFDGNNDMATFYRPVSNDFTLECWLCTTQSFGSGSGQWWGGAGLVDAEVDGLQRDFGLSLGAGKVLFGTGGSGDATIRSPNSIADGQWHHVAATRQKSNGALQLYVDGLLVASGANASGISLDACNQMHLGSLATSINFFQGKMDDVRIWNVVRTADQIREGLCHPLIGGEPGLAAYWKLDEAGGWMAYDSTPNHVDGTLWGPVWIKATVPPFIDLNVGLAGISWGSAAWGDYDNDGRLDVILAGSPDPEAPSDRFRTELWRNNGNGFTYVPISGLPQTSWSGVAWGDYDNDGRLDILLAGMTSSGGRIAQVWRNTGSGFTNINAGLPGVADASVAWGDYDNDGHLDILLTGSVENSKIAQVWRNNGNGTFSNINAALPGVAYGSVAWGDYDRDGRLDILLAGRSDWGPITQLWRNTGSGFTNIPIPLPGVRQGAVAWGDYDNDGLLDILVTGVDNRPGVVGQLWRNTGSGFVNVPIPGFPGLWRSSVAWGDYDNDGLLDIVIAGATDPYADIPLTQIWRNTGSGFANINAPLSPMRYCSVVWGDQDNDGRLDLLLAGQDAGTNALAQVWRNIAPAPGSAPRAPSALSATAAGRHVTLSWTAGSDDQTPPNGLTYNLRAGTSPNVGDVVAPQADLTNGFHRLPAMGNAQTRTDALLENLPFGFYYWSVQAVDSAFAGSPFAEENSFVVAVETLPATYLSYNNQALHGQVNPLGHLTTAWFEWGQTTNYGYVTPQAGVGSGSSALPLDATITVLGPGPHHYRIVATNDLGLHLGNDIAFTVEPETPVVVTLPVIDANPTGATLGGTANPRWAATLAWFEYGLTTKYDSTTPAVDAGLGPDPVPIDTTISGLLPWMTYHYRAIGSNSVGLTVGDDMTFTLPGPSMTAPTLSALPDMTLAQGGSTNLAFTVSPSGADVRVQCNNPVLVPAVGLSLSGSGTSYGLAIAPDPTQSGSAQIVVTASDGVQTASRTFMLTVTPGSDSSLLYLTDAHPVSAEAWRFRLVDLGTGSTNYAVEYRSGLSPTNGWILATNVTALPGGEFNVEVGPAPPGVGFFRVRGMRLLTAGFGTGDFTVDEGAGMVGPVIVFDHPYGGTINYTWMIGSETVTGSLLVNGTTAVIPVPLTDDWNINRLGSLTLRLEAGSGYAVTGTPQSSVTVQENDADWQGLLQTSDAMLGFVLGIRQTGNDFQGFIRSAGFGFFPTNAVPLAQLSFSEDAFCAVATNVVAPLASGGPLVGANQHLDLRLDAANGQPNQGVSPTRIEGVATIVMVVSNRPYLDTALTGTFVLKKPPTPPSTNEPALYPAP